VEERLQKLISQAGICSRRAAETLLAGGRVRVNGTVAKVGDKADPETDTVEVDGRTLGTPPEPVYLMLHKPRGYVTTLSDEKGRPTAASLVAGCGVRVYPVGRLDMDSEGLLLFTNDGALTQSLLHPKFEVDKRYEATVTGALSGACERLASLRELDGEPIRPAAVEELRREGNRAVLAITVHEGKNRQVRRMCAAADLEVVRLRRVAEHTLFLGDLPCGAWRYLTEEEREALKRERSI